MSVESIDILSITDTNQGWQLVSTAWFKPWFKPAEIKRIYATG